MTALAVALAVAFSAPGHTPRVNTKWHYVVRVTEHARPVRARLTVELVDPLGSAHPADVGETNRPITDYPINGVYRDYLTFPAASRGIPLKVRVSAVAGGQKRVVIYSVVPRR